MHPIILLYSDRMTTQEERSAVFSKAALLTVKETQLKTPAFDSELFIGYGSCVELCPEVFELRDDEKA